METDDWAKFAICNNVWTYPGEGNPTGGKFSVEVTETIKENIQTAGLYLQGSGTVTRMYYGTEESTAKTLYTNSDGYQIESGWSNSFDAFNDYDFTTAEIGDVLTFTVECTAESGDWHPLVVRSTDDTNVYNQYNTVGQTTLSVTIDASLLALLRGNSYITGDQFKLKGISYSHCDNVYVLNTKSDYITMSLLPNTADIMLCRKYDWNTTLCLPFDVDNVNTAFGHSAKAYEFKEYNAGLVFTEREHIEAGKPYFMTFDMTGVDDADKTMSITFDDVTIRTTLTNSAESGGLTFKGNYTVGMDMAGKYGVACVEKTPGNWVWAFYKGGTGSTLNAFSAYFDGSIPGSAQLGIILEDDETTSINNIEEQGTRSKEQEGMYNLAGQKVSDSYKGIVIKNGKKVIVK